MMMMMVVVVVGDRSFAEAELIPNAAKWDKEHSFPSAQVGG